MNVDWLRIYESNKKTLLAVAISVTREQSLAEDAVHDAFARLFASSAKPVDATLYAIQAVRNAALAMVRRQQRRREDQPFEVDTVDTRELNPLGLVLQSEKAEVLRNALLVLSEIQREVVVLRFMADMRYREISEVLDLPLSTVTSHCRRALGLMRNALETSHYE